MNANSLLERVANLNDDQAELGSRLNAVTMDMDARASALEQVLDEALGSLRSEMDKKIEVLEAALRNAMAESDNATRQGLGELSGMFEHHLNDEDERWERQRHHSMSTLEQRISQWRAEIDDSRRQDIADVAHSMVDIGNRLMALRRD